MAFSWNHSHWFSKTISRNQWSLDAIYIKKGRGGQGGGGRDGRKGQHVRREGKKRAEVDGRLLDRIARDQPNGRNRASVNNLISPDLNPFSHSLKDLVLKTSFF